MSEYTPQLGDRVRDPLPTTPGSKVEVEGWGVYTLRPDGEWYGKPGTGVTPGILDGYDHRVIHDAGATS